ncbi:MOSC domain-containing protein [Rhizorhabdus histidinilytica]|uniref:MOSC domain-containing protein n=1 Tax=Rhizorhabdus histidinilytica TaxID=439228 RepID=UPI0032200B28
MRLLNFCVGTVRVVEMAGEPVPTAHLKVPVAEPWTITDSGPAGDERAIHPDAIYAVSRDHYRFWADDLGKDRGEWDDGLFGENLTFDRLDETELRLGDVFAIGPEVRLVVAGPRVPCFKLAWRLGQPRTFQGRFAVSAHTGVYFGVVSAGRVRPGDTMSLVARDEANPTVADIALYCSGNFTPPLDGLRRALASAALSLTVRLILQSKLNLAERAAALERGAWTGWRDFTIGAVRRETADISSFELRPVDGKGIALADPGQFVTVRLEDGEGSFARAWSLSKRTEPGGVYRITVKREPDGRGSTLLHDRLSVGDRLALRAPAGRFLFDAGGFRPVVMIAAGIGITPFLPMLEAHKARGAEAPPLHFFYMAANRAAQALRAEVDALAEGEAHWHVRHVFTRPTGRDMEGRDYHHRGRIDTTRLREWMKDNYLPFGEGRIALPWYEVDLYMCGPAAFCRDMTRDLTAAGANPDGIFHEVFATPAAPEEAAVEQARLLFARSGIEVVWRAEDGSTLLDCAEAAGVAIPHDCRIGACHSCRTAITGGRTSAAVGDGHALLCAAWPLTAEVTIDA